MMNTAGKDILTNILSRLPAKLLLRSKCVCKYWYGVISDAEFMKWRSRHMILLPLSPLWSIDDNEDTPNSNSFIQVSPPLTTLPSVYILGTFDGVVLLAFESFTNTTNIILYNPFTRARKELLNPPFNKCHFSYVDGFGYGSRTPKDLKLVLFKHILNSTTCYVFSLEDRRWRSEREGLIQDFSFRQITGTFCNRCLHWIARRGSELFIVALEMTKMVFTDIHTPAGMEARNLIGTREGRLSMVCKGQGNEVVDVWVMKEYGVGASWSKLYSIQNNVPIYTLGNGKLVTVNNYYKEINIYDPEKEAYTKVNLSRCLNGPPFNHRPTISWNFLVDDCMEYVESLVSPSVLCPNF